MRWRVEHRPDAKLEEGGAAPAACRSARRRQGAGFDFFPPPLPARLIYSETIPIVRGHRINEHFGIGVPFARAINPITHTNWEGTGVEPDVKVAAADALTTAQKLAAEKIAAKTVSQEK